MRNIAVWSLNVALCATVALTAAATAITFKLEEMRPSPDRLPFFNFELDMFKAILAGFVVGMLGILIPAVATEARQRFEQRKASRIAYSEAKTEVDYLKLRLATTSFAEAANTLQRAHFRKHMAELYDDFPRWLKRRYGSKMNPDRWDTMMYGKLFCARLVLERNAEIWDQQSAAQRVALLDGALPTKSEIDVEFLPCASLGAIERQDTPV
jgi:hypothetical protein